MQTIGFGIVLVYLFQLISRVTEYIDTHQTFHLVLIVAGISLLAALANMTFTHAFDNAIGISLAIFTAWAIFELPFSSWRGGSFNGLVNSWMKSYLTYIIVVSLIANLTQLRKALFWISVATATIVMLSFQMGIQAESDDRLSLQAGSLSNSNDLAMELLIGLPFLIYIGLDKKRSIFVRVPALLVAPLVLYVTLKTGSRSGLITIAVMAIMAFFRTSMINRLKMAVVALVLIAIAPFVLSNDLKERYGTILSGTTLSNASDVVLSASLSEQSRRDLMVHALILTGRHPLFGVGMDQFANASADLSLERGETPMWHPVHSFLLLVMAETGIPGVLFYASALFFSLKAVVAASRIAKRRNDPLAREICEALLYSMVGFAAFMLFSPAAFLFQFPLMAALATVLARAVGKAPAPAPAAIPWAQPAATKAFA